MGTMELETYGKALAAIKRHKAISPSWKSIAISHSRYAGQDGSSPYDNATLRDVAHALWKRRSVIHAHILVLRTASLPCDAEQARRLGRQLTKHSDRHNPPDRKMQRKRNLGLTSLRIVNGKDMHDGLRDVATLAYRHGTLAPIVLAPLARMTNNPTDRQLPSTLGRKFLRDDGARRLYPLNQEPPTLLQRRPVFFAERMA